MTILDDLRWRGLLHDCTHPDELASHLASSPVTLYSGFDPTADSLHVGNLVPLLALRRFQEAGHRPIALAGGATGMIGDPGGRTTERQLLTKEQLQANIEGVKSQLVRLLDFDPSLSNPAVLLDNATWTAPISFLDFLRDTGKHFTVNMMVAKESVRARMEDRESGISFTEFSYMLLQAHDFWYLNREHGCTLQIGGSDQWGNITAGIDLCRKKAGAQVFGISLPLITNSDGSKFGKSIGGAPSLDPNQTSPYRFYQFFVQTDDRDVIPRLKIFTFLSHEEIESLSAAHAEHPEAREAHKALAAALTNLVHGETAKDDAIRATGVLFGGSIDGISESALAELTSEVPNHVLPTSELGSGIALIDLLVRAGLSQSKGQARKDIQGGGTYINNKRRNDVQTRVTREEFFFHRFLLLRKGKRNYAAITLE
ncbi:MAG: tyrosine--tRNA ligase [Verrucomicrobia bacterium]|nr:MAG: tyrosine--tRNA ligase [Verrucomicrobiota bacterium]